MGNTTGWFMEANEFGPGQVGRTHAISVVSRNRNQAGAMVSETCRPANQSTCAHRHKQDAGGVQRVGAALGLKDQVHAAAAGPGRQVMIHRRRRRLGGAVQGRVLAQDVKCRVVPAPGCRLSNKACMALEPAVAAGERHSAPVVQDAHVDGLGALALKVAGCQRAHALPPNVARQVDLRLRRTAGCFVVGCQVR